MQGIANNLHIFFALIIECIQYLLLSFNSCILILNYV